MTTNWQRFKKLVPDFPFALGELVVTDYRLPSERQPWIHPVRIGKIAEPGDHEIESMEMLVESGYRVEDVARILVRYGDLAYHEILRSVRSVEEKPIVDLFWRMDHAYREHAGNKPLKVMLPDGRYEDVTAFLRADDPDERPAKKQVPKPVIQVAAATSAIPKPVIQLTPAKPPIHLTVSESLSDDGAAVFTFRPPNNGLYFNYANSIVCGPTHLVDAWIKASPVKIPLEIIEGYPHAKTMGWQDHPYEQLRSGLMRFTLPDGWAAIVAPTQVM